MSNQHVHCVTYLSPPVTTCHPHVTHLSPTCHHLSPPVTHLSVLQACHDYLELAQVQGKRWERMLKYERDQRLRLEEIVEQLAKQHDSLEKQARRKQLATVSHSHSHNNSKSEGINININHTSESTLMSVSQ